MTITHALVCLFRSIAHNNLQGTVPGSWAACKLLETLHIQGNPSMCGDIPATLKVPIRYWCPVWECDLYVALVWDLCHTNGTNLLLILILRVLHRSGEVANSYCAEGKNESNRKKGSKRGGLDEKRRQGGRPKEKMKVIETLIVGCGFYASQER